MAEVSRLAVLLPLLLQVGHVLPLRDLTSGLLLLPYYSLFSVVFLLFVVVVVVVGECDWEVAL